MYIIIEGYPEFGSDVQELWSPIMVKFNFDIKSVSDNEVVLENKNGYVHLLLDGSDRVGYLIENKETNVIYDEMSLYLFFNIEFDRTVVDNDDYPISKSEWFDLLGDENYRDICKIDLPIVQNEILTHFKLLLDGDFSFEKDYLKWQEWINLEKNNKASFNEITFKAYQKYITNT